MSPTTGYRIRNLCEVIITGIHSFLRGKMHCGTKSIKYEWLESFNAAGQLISRNGSHKPQPKCFNAHKENYGYKDKANTDLLKVYKPFLA